MARRLLVLVLVVALVLTFPAPPVSASPGYTRGLPANAAYWLGRSFTIYDEDLTGCSTGTLPTGWTVIGTPTAECRDTDGNPAPPSVYVSHFQASASWGAISSQFDSSGYSAFTIRFNFKITSFSGTSSTDIAMLWTVGGSNTDMSGRVGIKATRQTTDVGDLYVLNSNLGSWSDTGVDVNRLQWYSVQFLVDEANDNYDVVLDSTEVASNVAMSASPTLQYFKAGIGTGVSGGGGAHYTDTVLLHVPTINENGGIWAYYLTDAQRLDWDFGIGAFHTAEYVILLAELYELTGRGDINASMMASVDYLIGLQQTDSASAAYGGLASDVKNGTVSDYYYTADALVGLLALTKAYTLTGSTNNTIRSAMDLANAFIRKMQTGNQSGLVDQYYGGFMQFVRHSNGAYNTQLWANDGYGFAEGLWAYYQATGNATSRTAYEDFVAWVRTAQDAEGWFNHYYDPLPYGDNAWHINIDGTVYTDNNYHSGYTLLRAYEILGTPTYLSGVQAFDTYFASISPTGGWPGYTDVVNDVRASTYDDYVVSAYAVEIRRALGRNAVAPADYLAGKTIFSSNVDAEGGLYWSNETTQEASSTAALAAWALGRYSRAIGQPEVLWAASMVRNATWNGVTWAGDVDSPGSYVLTAPVGPTNVTGASEWFWDATRKVLTINTTVADHASPAHVEATFPSSGGTDGGTGDTGGGFLGDATPTSAASILLLLVLMLVMVATPVVAWRMWRRGRRA